MLKMKNISKSFPGVKALDNINLEVKKGTVHGLVGENGAGKSTLIKILSGAYTADHGEVYVDGELIENATPSLMIEKKIAVIYQELMMLEHRTVGENIFAGRLPKNKLGIVNYKKMFKDAKVAIEKIGMLLDPHKIVSELSVAQRQMVEIAKAMSRDAKIIVLDEPTAVLCDSELEVLFELVKTLSEKKGITFIYISHRLHEVFDLCDKVTILKDGILIETGPVENYTSQSLVEKMVGREVEDIYPSKDGRITGDVVLQVKNLCRDNIFHDISFELKTGEILGISGLAGAGRTEVLRAIMGADPIDSGEVIVRGEKKNYKNPEDAIADKLGMVPEERKLQGLTLQQNLIFNTCLQSPDKFRKNGFIRPSKELENTKNYIERFNARPNNPDMIIENMSGGNQQKIVISKNLSAESEILLIDEPTRGIDVGAKQEIYRILDELVRNGKAIVVVSSELPELLGLCDRILVMREGEFTGSFRAEEATEQLIMSCAVC